MLLADAVTSVHYQKYPLITTHTMPKKLKIEDSDKTAFNSAMRGVKPLAPTQKIHWQPKPLPPKRQQQTIEEELPSFPFSDYENLDPVGSEDLLEFVRGGIQHKILRKLRQGQYNVEAILDLHGKTVEEARQTLSRFLWTCQDKGVRHALVIHGKGRSGGRPILKNKLNHWLRQTEEVIAFCSATGKDGRGGALYVLLRR